MASKSNTNHVGSAESTNAHAEYRLMWKIDIWILPVLTVLFLLSFIDKYTSFLSTQSRYRKADGNQVQYRQCEDFPSRCRPEVGGKRVQHLSCNLLRRICGVRHTMHDCYTVYQTARLAPRLYFLVRHRRDVPRFRVWLWRSTYRTLLPRHCRGVQLLLLFLPAGAVV